MIKKREKKEKIDFLLQNKHYKRLQLYLYLLSIVLITIIYFLIIMIFSAYSNSMYITVPISLIIGFYLFFNKDKLVIKISEIIEDKKRNNIKKEKKDGLRTTLRKITPKNNKLKLNIKSKETIKEKFIKLKSRIKTKKNKKAKDYIEIE